MNKKQVIIMTIISLLISTCTIVASFIIFTRNNKSLNNNHQKCDINVEAKTISVKSLPLNISFSGVDNIVSESVFSYKIKLSSLNTNASYYFVWKWDEKSDKYYKLTKDNEYTVSIISEDKEIVKETQLPNFDDRKMILGNDIISSLDSPIEKEYIVKVKFYNINGENQNAHLGNNYLGSIYLEKVSCT